MTRTYHDRYGKTFLAGLLETEGACKVNYELESVVRYPDIYFTPNGPPSERLCLLGCLGRMVSRPSIIEPFRNPAGEAEVLECIAKRVLLCDELKRKARREKRRFRKAELPWLWVTVPGASERLLQIYGASPASDESWPEGFYRLPPAFHGTLIVLDRLPRVYETLWLRLMGRDKTLREAFEDLRSLPKEHPLRDNTLKILYDYFIIKEKHTMLREARRELVMGLSAEYLRMEAETRRQGWVEGRAEGRVEGWREGRVEGRVEGWREGRAHLLEGLLMARFGYVDQALLRLVPALLKLPPDECSRLILNLSRDELIARVGNGGG